MVATKNPICLRVIKLIRHHDVAKFWKNLKFPIFSYSCCTKCRVEANNNREEVDVCVKHVVKRPNKRSALVYIHNSTLRMLGRFTPCLAQRTTAWRLLFALNRHFVPLEYAKNCEF